ncbi:MPN domain-containing protein-like isoform X2 [Mercenaria mercenaria]|uniref:MPN domain-containing protein-like isoform X2 n=1 Tax=Mercenaria mercenaria TaxID=6596 RepID=UPI00234E7A1E|nr:MPN domain-containing protein-like isoform X2 [Mercenaria mercenaria]XP_045180078.2 MPN domain-containing protein-like isoform X2 [Mercenaria mercenaria]
MSEDIPLDEMDEVDDIEDEDNLDELGVEQSTPEKRARHAITGRGVTLQMLMADGIIKPGDGVLSLEYLGQKFTADLQSNGKIKSNETDQIFSSPSSWAIFCKKLVNPAKKSGCGWASVKYKGRKLDSWKTSWFRQQKPRKPHIPGSQSPASSISSETIDLFQKPGLADDTSSINSESTIGTFGMTPCSSFGTDLQAAAKDLTDSSSVKSSVLEDDNGVLDLTTKPKSKDSIPSSISEPANLCFMGEQEEALNLSLKATPAKKSVEVKVEKRPESPEITKNDRTPVKHSSLPDRSKVVDMNQLVSCEMFTSLGKIQPYTVSMSTNSLLLMDFHCHLTTSEVVGYLGGKWDQSAQHLSIQQAFPCRCRLSDSQNAALVEEEIRNHMKHLGMSLVGWFHSHPYSLPEPSVRDLECQMSYQLKMKGAKSTYFPCVGIINSPYYGKSLKTESTVQMYMVMPPPESSNTDYGIPMSLKYSVKQNHSVSEELLTEMKKLVEFYRGAPDWISFQHSWHPSVTYLEKLKTSLGNKLPEDQLDNGTFMEFVQHVLTS